MSMTRNEFLQEAAIRAMQGCIVANPALRGIDADIAATFAVRYAHALTVEFEKSGEFYEVDKKHIREWERV